MQASLKARWSLASGSALTLRRWDDEVVVHHALSNDTHRLTESAGRMLQSLGTAGILDADELAREVGLDEGEVHAALVALEALDLVTRC